MAPLLPPHTSRPRSRGAHTLSRLDGEWRLGARCVPSLAVPDLNVHINGAYLQSCSASSFSCLQFWFCNVTRYRSPSTCHLSLWSCECTLHVDIPTTSTNLRNSTDLLPDEYYWIVHHDSPISVGLSFWLRKWETVYLLYDRASAPIITSLLRPLACVLVLTCCQTKIDNKCTVTVQFR